MPPPLGMLDGDSRRTSCGTLMPSRWAHEGLPLVVIQRQLGHANLGIASVYLQGIDSGEIISTVHGRPAPTISATAGLQMTRLTEARSLLARGWSNGGLGDVRRVVIAWRSVCDRDLAG
jgi:hypothetical protein